MTTIEERLAALEAEIAELRAAARADAAAGARIDAPADVADGATSSDRIAEAPVSRRHALRTAGAVAAGALASSVAVSLATASPAAAGPLGPVNGNPAIEATAIPSTGTAITASTGSGFGLDAVATDGTAVRGVANTGTGIFGISTTGPGVLGLGDSTGVGVGATSNSGIGLVADGGTYGVQTTGTTAAMLLFPIGNAPPTRGVTNFTTGAITVDQNGNLWYCVAGGTPGTWRQLAGTSTAGSFHPLTPARVYDSRNETPFPGRLSTGQRRTISVASSRDANGSVVNANFVPDGATAVFANVTVTDTAFSGWLAVNPGGTTTVSASAINWATDGQNLANGLALTINAATRQVTVIAGGPGSTDFVVDVFGYWR